MYEFNAWLEDKGLDPTTLSRESLTRLEGRWREELHAEQDGVPFAIAEDDPIARAEHFAAPYARIGDQNMVRRVRGIGAAAYGNGLSRQQSELALIRGSRPDAVNAYAPSVGRPEASDVLVAALLLSTGTPIADVGKACGDKVTDLAASREFRGAGFHTVMRHLLAAAGRPVPRGSFSGSDVAEVFDIGRNVRADAGSSTYSLPTILGEFVNKQLMVSFQAANVTWNKFCRSRPADDFKTLHNVRLNVLDRLATVAPAGELKSSTLSESAYTNQVSTKGRVITIPRTNLINDDVGALANVAPGLSQMAAITLERDVYTTLLGNASSFFGSGNSNVSTGAGSALADAGLATAIQRFEEARTPNGDPILLRPTILLVPSALHATARKLINSGALVGTSTTDKPVPSSNVWQDYLTIVSGPLLGTALGLSGGSDAAWYITVGPGDYSIMEVAFLNGRQMPFVETAEADFQILGVSMRIVFDYGVAFLEPRGGIRSAGS
jgi:hypothetical protein